MTTKEWIDKAVEAVDDCDFIIPQSMWWLAERCEELEKEIERSIRSTPASSTSRP